MSYFIEKLICKYKRYELRIFQLTKNKNVPLIYVKKPKKPIVAFKKFYGILIDNLFYKLDNEEQKSAIWHEIYHTKSIAGIKLFFWLPIKRLISNKNRKYNIYQLDEFVADNYAKKKNGKRAIIGLLNKLNQMENKCLIKTNLKNHPTIKDRIKRVKED